MTSLALTDVRTGYAVPEVLRQFERDGDFAFIIDLIDCFLADAKEKLRAIRMAAVSLDLPLVAKQSHSLKGSAANMGLGAIAAACHELEQSAKAGLDIDYARAIDGIEAAVAEARSGMLAYRDRLSANGRKEP